MTEEGEVGVLSDESHVCHDITWTISDFQSLPKSAGSSVDSPEFTFADATWCLRCYPHGRLKGSDFATLNIVRLRSNVSDHHVFYYLASKWTNDANEYDFSSTLCFNDSSPEHGWEYLVKHCLPTAVHGWEYFVKRCLLSAVHHHATTFTCQMRIVNEETSSNMERTVPDASEEFPAINMTEEGEVGVLSDESHVYHDITWTIPHFHSLLKSAVSSVDSPKFNFADATWCLRCYPNERQKGSKHVMLNIVRLRSNVSDHRVFYYFAVKNNSSQNIEDFYTTTCFNDISRADGPKYFVDLSSLLKAVISPPNDTLTFFCQMRIVNDEATSNVEKTVPDASEDIDTLCQNFRNVLLRGQNHDLTLKVMDRDFPAHKDILRARSEVFDSMLTHDMVETNSGVITIEDCDPAAFEQFLLFIYSGKVETLDQSNMLGLYYIADKYAMTNLKRQCREFIKRSLSSRVICDVVELASKHSDPDLLACATEYFADHINEILQTVEWQSFLKLNAITANEVLIKATKKLTDKISSLELNR